MIQKFSVGGMTCSACSSGIERNVGKLDGVNSVSVSLLAKEMHVDFNENKISAHKIITVVESLGYTASIYGSVVQDKYSDAKKLKKRFIASFIVLIPLMYLCMGAMLGLPLFNDNRINFSLQFVLATLILVLNRKFFINGVKAVVHKSPNMDTLVSLGSFSAYIYSIVVTVMLFIGSLNSSHTFFESSAMVLTLVTLGKWLEELSKIKTGDAVEKLGMLIPKTVTLVVDGTEKVVLTSELKVGDKVIFKAGDYVAVDGAVIEGHANVDKSALTGESLPEEVTEGHFVQSGSILKNGYLIVQAQKVGQDTLFAQIVEIVRTAGASKAPIQKIADKISGVFVPVVTAIAILTFITWLIVSKDVYQAFNFGINVLVISCPCALGLATPVTVMAATGRGANCGILFKDASALQNACKINCVLLDKTATITVGKPSVSEYIDISNEDKDYVFMVVSALEGYSKHPLAECIKEYCGQSTLEVENYEYVTGKGIIGVLYGEKYYLGNFELLPDGIRNDVISGEKYLGKTLVYFADDAKIIGVFAVSDSLKVDSKDAIKVLKDLDIKTVMITGDNESSAKYIAEQVGLNEYEAQVLPQDKYRIVEKYKSEGYFVAMVGDGINDSPALKSANIGVAMGTGTDVAIDSSDVVIVNGSLSALSEMIKISAKSLRIIKQNLFWAFFYNMLGIPIAAGVLSTFGIVLTPALASLMMSFSSLFVVTNALRMTARKKKIEKISLDKKRLNFTVPSIMCMHCVSKVKDALYKIDGVLDVKISLEKKTVTLESASNVTVDEIRERLKNIGYEIDSVTEN